MKALKDIEKKFYNHSRLAAVSWRILFFIVVLYLFSVVNKNLFKKKLKERRGTLTLWRNLLYSLNNA